MTDIRELMREAAAEVDVGPGDPVSLVRTGLSRRRRVRGAMCVALAAVATAIAVPVTIAGSPSPSAISTTVSRGVPLLPLPLYQVVNPAWPARHRRSITEPSRPPWRSDVQIQIRRRPALVLHVTLAEVIASRAVAGHPSWTVSVYAPEAANLYRHEVEGIGNRPGRQFAFVYRGKAYRIIPIHGDPNINASLGYYLDKAFAVSMARGLTTAALVDPPPSTR